jgi:hypothetical protein
MAGFQFGQGVGPDYLVLSLMLTPMRTYAGDTYAGDRGRESGSRGIKKDAPSCARPSIFAVLWPALPWSTTLCNCCCVCVRAQPHTQLLAAPLGVFIFLSKVLLWYPTLDGAPTSQQGVVTNVVQ